MHGLVRVDHAFGNERHRLRPRGTGHGSSRRDTWREGHRPGLLDLRILERHGEGDRREVRDRDARVGHGEARVVNTGSTAALFALRVDNDGDWQALEAVFPPPKGEQSMTRKPPLGRWDLTLAIEGCVKLENTGTAPVGQWNHVRLVCDGPHIEHWMNGFKYCEYEIGSDDFKQPVANSKFAKWPKFVKQLEDVKIEGKPNGDRQYFVEAAIPLKAWGVALPSGRNPSGTLLLTIA